MDKTLGARLRALRERVGLTATALAGDRLSVATVSRIEHGTIDPSLATLRYLADRLGCSAADLLTDDAAAAAARAALDNAEAWLLLGQPAQALRIVQQERATPAAGDAAPAAADGASVPSLAAPRQRLAWAAARASAQPDPAAVPALDAALAAARRANDRWAVARLAATRSGALPDADAARLLQSALAGLSPNDAAPEEAVARAQLLLLLARGEEQCGALETARGLYTRAAAGVDVFRQPADAARRLLDSGGSERAPALALAATAAAEQTWTAATLALARLDLQAGQSAAAARRLRQLPHAVGGAAALTADLAAELRRTAALLTNDGDGSAADPAWLSFSSALRARNLEEAEREAMLLAASLGANEASQARALWLRLAQAWADAGNAPRAAQALRVARAANG